VEEEGEKRKGNEWKRKVTREGEVSGRVSHMKKKVRIRRV
jgi:hypothetical protein